MVITLETWHHYSHTVGLPGCCSRWMYGPDL